MIVACSTTRMTGNGGNNTRIFQDLLHFNHFRPLPLLLGVLYKVQKNVHHHHHHAEDYSDSMKKNEELINTLAYFWNMIMAADESLRDGMESTETDDEVRELMEKNKNDYAFKLGINIEQV